VHIADVSHFIKPGTAIDKEAALRGTTVYLIDKVLLLLLLLLIPFCGHYEGQPVLANTTR